MTIVLEWDEPKRRSNLAKHGVDFLALEPMFRGKLVEEDDHHRDYGEHRIRAVGELHGVIPSVVYTWRGDRRRLISARRARADEREKYQAKFGRG